MTPEELEKAVQYAKYIIWWRINVLEEYLLKPEFALYWCHTHQIHRQVLISSAKDGWDGPHKLLYEMARFLTEIGDPLPLWLQQYVVFAARTGRARRSKKGRDPIANLIWQLNRPWTRFLSGLE